MAEAITVVLSEETSNLLEEVTLQDDMPADKLVEEAVREYLFFRRFRLLRERMIPQAQAQGIYTDQDVFEQVS